MSTGILTRVEFRSGEVCPIANSFGEDGIRIHPVSSDVYSPSHDVSTGQCTGERDVHSATIENQAVNPGERDRVFDGGASQLYRLTHPERIGCVCEHLERYGCPPVGYTAKNETLEIEFYAPDTPTLQEIVAELRERFPPMDVKSLIRSQPEEARREDVFRLVRVSDLTAKQTAALRTAYELGYFDRPRRANLSEVAAALEAHPSTVREHLSAAEKKILGQLLGDDRWGRTRTGETGYGKVRRGRDEEATASRRMTVPASGGKNT